MTDTEDDDLFKEEDMGYFKRKLKRKYKKTIKKKKKKKKKMKEKRQTKKGKEGIDFKTFYIDPNKPSTCRPRIEKVSKCKSHRMRLPRRSKCKSHRGQFMINPMLKHMKLKTPKKKKCNKSIVHFINL
tara:strand:+ start:2476 stop:2859 length:384 start_codon:yes stop_codon:yes gene_type:complete